VIILTGRIYIIISYDWIPASAGMTSKRRSRPKLELNPLSRAIRTLKSTQIRDEP